MIFIAGKLCHIEPGLSSRFKLISGMISGASQWLEWAIAEKDFWLSVGSEEELLTRLQDGLHGSGLICLAPLDLLVHPLRLAQMDDEDLKVLSRALKDDSPKTADQVLSANGLITGRDLDRATEWLETLQVDTCPVFRVMALSDHIRILNLFTGIPPEEAGPAQKDAAQFAIEDAQTPPEFANRYEFFTAAREKIKGNLSKAAKLSRINQAWATLSPLCNRLLETFSLNRGGYDSDLAPLIRSSLTKGFKLGFLSKASAMKNVMVHTPFLGESGSGAEDLIDSYMSQTTDLIRQGDLDRTLISQDGMTRSFVYSTPGKTRKTATINVDIFGVVTIASCQL